ncbi:unnamed protein product [Ectocarpus fasciculatus]
MAEYVDDAEYAVEPVSDPEKLEIATHMLMASPPGQFWEVLTDVRKLLPEGLLDDARAQEVAKAYNAQEGVIVEVGDRNAVLAAEGAVTGSGGGFKDSLGGGVFAVDHVAPQVTGEGPAVGEAEEAAADPALEEQRQALQEALEAYRASHFSVAEKSAACVFEKDGGGGLVAYVSARKHNLRNWWSGTWSGRYTVAVGAGSAEVCGAITVRGHYFEDGNIQLQTSKQVGAKTVAFTSPKSLAEAAVAYMKESESALHEGLEEMYDRMPGVTLRSMRRTKPITADSFTWNVAKIRMRNTLAQAATNK